MTKIRWLLSVVNTQRRQKALKLGMMYRRSVSPDMAMLFFMDGGDRPHCFWMKNTLVSLDIIYINANNEVVSIKPNAQPLNILVSRVRHLLPMYSKYWAAQRPGALKKERQSPGQIINSTAPPAINLCIFAAYNITNI